MQDLFIVIPGIMGSVLTRDGDDVWNPGWGLATKIFKHRQWIESLALGDDDPADTGPVDGLIPTSVISTKGIVPGLVSIDGYSELDRSLNETFGSKLIEGSPLEPEQRLDAKDGARFGYPNYYRFAYDWRRDNRSSALRLHDLIEVALTNLQQQRNPKAKVVILAHSMGGLVARYYMYGLNPRTGEPFEGWRNVRELFSMGTPYRGSPDSLRSLHHGFKKLFVDFSETLRSYTSVYQLLPRYPMVLKADAPPPGRRTVDDYLRPHEVRGIDGFDTARAEAAYNDFHLVVDRYLAELGDYHRLGIVPDVGFGHPTLNSAELTADGELEVRREVPDYFDAAYRGGDGTVPLISAIPLELDDQRGYLRYTNQTHGSLQTDDRTLSAEIANRLAQSQAGTTSARNPVAGDDVTARPAIGIDSPQYVMAGEDAQVTITVERADGVDVEVEVDQAPVISIVDLASGRAVTDRQMVDSGQPVPLPTQPGEYAINATAGPLQSRALLAVIDGG